MCSASSGLEGVRPKACTYKGERKSSSVFLFPPLGLEGLGNVLAVHPPDSSSLLRPGGALPAQCPQRMGCNMGCV